MRRCAVASGVNSVSSSRCRCPPPMACMARHAVPAHAALRRATSCGLTSSSSSSATAAPHHGTSTVACRSGGSSLDKQVAQGTAQGTSAASDMQRSKKALDKKQAKEKQLAKDTGTGPVPVADMQRKKGCCYGCGSRLQIEVPLGAGYVEPEKYATKKTHRQLDKVLCERCAELCNGAMIPGVMDFNQRLAEQRAKVAAAAAATAAASPLDPQLEARVELLGKALISPEELRDQLMEVRGKKAVVVMLVDLLDAAGSLMTKVRDMVGKNPMILVGTKLDLLPEGSHPRDVAEWLMDSATRKRLNVVSVHLVSSHTGEGVPQATAKICRERKGRDVYVIGAANVGKSAFVRAMLRDMGKFDGDNFDPAAMANGRFLPVESAMPGTTLGIIPLQAFATGGTLYDTPGVHLHHRIPHMLSPEELRAIHPRKRLAAFVPPTPLELTRPDQVDEIEGDTGTGADVASSNDQGDEIGNAADSAAVRGRRQQTAAQAAASAAKAQPVSGTYVWGGLARIDVLAAPPSTTLSFVGPQVLRVYSMPLLRADQSFELEAGADTADSAQAGAGPSSRASATATTADGGGGKKGKKQPSELVVTRSVTERGGLVPHDLLVAAAGGAGGVGVGGRSGALADIAISGLPGWVTFWAPRAKHNLRVRVWAPRGVEVFLRPPLPSVSPLSEQQSGSKNAKEVDGEMSEAQLRAIVEEYGDAAGGFKPVNAGWWEAAANELDFENMKISFGDDKDEDDEDEDNEGSKDGGQGDEGEVEDDEEDELEAGSTVRVVSATVEDILRRPRLEDFEDMADGNGEDADDYDTGFDGGRGAGRRAGGRGAAGRQAEGGHGRKTSSDYWGVTWEKGRSAWAARLWNPETQRMERCGRYASEEDAARAYDCATVKLRGPDVKRNFPDEIISEPPVSLGDERTQRKSSRCISVGWRKENSKWVSTLRDSQTKSVKHLGYFATEVEAAWKHDVEALKQGPEVPDNKLNFSIQVRTNPSGPPPHWLLDGKPEPEQPCGGCAS
ncbi:hypothetical protein FOA52_007709 [Chlamydomonas sp. UWO 241]|nr:hypothetical protein FOA52_007709 [Chlamydomonas sp. UWO 241]